MSPAKGLPLPLSLFFYRIPQLLPCGVCLDDKRKHEIPAKKPSHSNISCTERKLWSAWLSHVLFGVVYLIYTTLKALPSQIASLAWHPCPLALTEASLDICAGCQELPTIDTQTIGKM
eukprot:scaffold75271_cov15-Tisochrysis_lutea.AAC.2